MAQTLYPDPALRPMGDLDLLVRRENLERAVPLVREMGYWENIPERRPDQLMGHHYNFIDEKNMVLELQLEPGWQQCCRLACSPAGLGLVSNRSLTNRSIWHNNSNS